MKIVVINLATIFLGKHLCTICEYSVSKQMKKIFKILSYKGGNRMDYQIIAVVVVITVLITVAVMKLWTYIKDFKITPEEVKKVEAIIFETVNDILLVASASKTKAELLIIITNIVTEKLDLENITCFKNCEIDKMITSIMDKLEEKCPNNKT